MMHYTELGYSEYGDFLVGKEWKAMSQYFYENRSAYACNICGARQGLVLHKRSYKFLSLAELKRKYRNDKSKVMRYLHSYLVYLCRTCHNRVHFLPNGERVALEYRVLKDRELALKKSAKQNGTSSQEVVRLKSKGFLGSYFKNVIKR